jgi:hypothetical protein
VPAPPTDPTALLGALRSDFPDWGILYDGKATWIAARGRSLELTAPTAQELRAALLARMVTRGATGQPPAARGSTSMTGIDQQERRRPQPPRGQVFERLQVLAAALTTAGLEATLEESNGSLYVKVKNLRATDYADSITCDHHAGDGFALWLFRSRGEPIAPACNVTAAVSDIRAMLTPRPGGHRGPA